MPLFIASSAQCAIREDNGQFVFHNPAEPTAQASGTWNDAVILSVRILAQEARTNGGIIGTVAAIPTL